MESNPKKSNTRTVFVMALVFIFVLGVLAYVSGAITNLAALSDAPETTIILTSALVGVSIAAIVALVRLSRENR